jgi:hypothetical protein
MINGRTKMNLTNKYITLVNENTKEFNCAISSVYNKWEGTIVADSINKALEKLIDSGKIKRTSFQSGIMTAILNRDSIDYTIQVWE